MAKVMMMTKAESESLSSYNSEEEKHIEVDILQLATQLDDLSPLYWDPCIDHLYFQNPENREYSAYICTLSIPT